MHAKRRAITLAGGGPEAALHIGALALFEREAKVHFDIWALSCVGAWVGIYYHQCEKESRPNRRGSFFANKYTVTIFLIRAFRSTRYSEPIWARSAARQSNSCLTSTITATSCCPTGPCAW